jgi:hypothetical protein
MSDIDKLAKQKISLLTSLMDLVWTVQNFHAVISPMFWKIFTLCLVPPRLDELSRDFHIEDSHLSELLMFHFPEQVPFGLKILPVPPDIVSWLTCLLLSQPQVDQWSKVPMRSKFALGLASRSTLGSV